MMRSSGHLADFGGQRIGLGLQVPTAAPFDLAGPLDQPSEEGIHLLAHLGRSAEARSAVRRGPVSQHPQVLPAAGAAKQATVAVPLRSMLETTLSLADARVGEMHRQLHAP